MVGVMIEVWGSCYEFDLCVWEFHLQRQRQTGHVLAGGWGTTTTATNFGEKCDRGFFFALRRMCIDWCDRVEHEQADDVYDGAADASAAHANYANPRWGGRGAQAG